MHRSAWQLFRKHHYLNTSISDASVCFCAFWNDVPVAFTAVLHFPHSTSKTIKREHRTVCLPDYQGVGIGNAMSAYIGSVCRGIEMRFQSQTSHPAMILARAKSNVWKMTRQPDRIHRVHSATSGVRSWRVQTKRITASFEYCGPALDRQEAARVWRGVS